MVTSKLTLLLAWGKPALVKFLRSKLVKAALKKILGSAMAGGIKAWLIQYVVTELYDEVAKPLIQLAFRRVGYHYEVKKGEHILKRIENAETIEEWSNAANDA